MKHRLFPTKFARALAPEVHLWIPTYGVCIGRVDTQSGETGSPAGGWLVEEALRIDLKSILVFVCNPPGAIPLSQRLPTPLTELGIIEARECVRRLPGWDGRRGVATALALASAR